MIEEYMAMSLYKWKTSFKSKWESDLIFKCQLYSDIMYMSLQKLKIDPIWIYFSKFPLENKEKCFEKATIVDTITVYCI